MAIVNNQSTVFSNSLVFDLSYEMIMFYIPLCCVLAISLLSATRAGTFLLKPIYWIDLLQNIIFKWIMRKEEYRADKFAVDLGFGKGLISTLQKVSENEIREDGFWNKYTANHPPAESRVDRIDALIANIS